MLSYFFKLKLFVLLFVSLPLLAQEIDTPKTDQEQDYKTLLDNLNTRLKENPDSPEINFNLGVVNYNLENYEAALRSFEKANVLSKELGADAMYNIGNVHYKLAEKGQNPKEYEKAITAYRDALKKDKNLINAGKNLELTRLKLKEMQEQQNQQQDQQQQQQQDQQQQNQQEQNQESNNLDELKQKQEQLKNETEQNQSSDAQEEQAKRQEQLSKEAQNLKESSSSDAEQKKLEKAMKEMSKATEQLKNGDSKAASEAQARAIEALQENPQPTPTDNEADDILNQEFHNKPFRPQSFVDKDW